MNLKCASQETSPLPKSKSLKKREAHLLKDIGVLLTKLSITKIEALSVSDTLKIALVEAKAIHQHGALKRQHQLIGKIMRSEDEATLATLLQTFKDQI